MDLLFRLIEFLVRAALDQNKRTNAPVTQVPTTSQPSAQPHASRAMPAPPITGHPQPLVTSMKAATQDPLYDDGWRVALTVLAIIALIVMLSAWAVYLLLLR